MCHSAQLLGSGHRLEGLVQLMGMLVKDAERQLVRMGVFTGNDSRVKPEGALGLRCSIGHDSFRGSYGVRVYNRR